MAENDEPMIETPADFGHFLLEKELGHGGMGGVYLARDKMLDRKVGIKVMLKSLGEDPKFVERFQREAQAAARLNHPNIAQIYSFGQEQGMPYIAMELVPGGSLDKEMEAKPGALDVKYVMRVGQQVADALALAAESGLVHGDVKPENVLFDTDGNAKLVDFGLAAMQGDSDEIWGTPYYISPEKVRRQKIDFRADIYSLGGTLYHVLTGVPPFDGPDPTAVVKARFDGPPKKPSEIRPDIPPEVDAIIMRMLELEPSMRYPTYQSLLGDFKRYLAKAGPAKTGKTTGPKIKFKGMKPKVSLSATATGTGEAADGEVADLQPIGDQDREEEEEKPMNVGAMVGLVVGGVLLVLLLVGGGLWWYTSSAKSTKEQQTSKQITDQQNQARQTIEKSTHLIQGVYDAYHKRFLKAQSAVGEAARKVQTKLPEEMKAAADGVFTPPPTDELLKAIALTNVVAAVAAPPPAAAEKPATTNAVAAASAEKKGDAKADEKKRADANAAKEVDKEAEAEKALAEAEAKAEGKDAKAAEKGEDKQADGEKKDAPAAEEPPAEEAKPAEVAKPVMPLPQAVKKFKALWEDLCKCQAADIRLHKRVNELFEKAREADKLTAQDKATTDALSQLANDLASAYSALDGAGAEKWLKDARIKVQGIEKRAGNYAKESIEKIEREIEKKLAEEVKKAAAEKAAAEKAEAEERHKELIAKEQAKAQESFDGLIDEIKSLKWERCTSRLTRRREQMETREGTNAVDSAIRKIAFMEGVQKHFIKYAKGFRFKSKRGALLATVTDIDDKALIIQKMKYEKGKYVPDKKPTRVVWEDFYALKDQERKYSDFSGQDGKGKGKGDGKGKGEGTGMFLGFMNQLINELVVNGRENTKISARDRSDHMLGVALTLKLLLGDREGVDKFIPELVKEAVTEKNENEKRRGFGPNRKWAVQWFPEVQLPESDDDE